MCQMKPSHSTSLAVVPSRLCRALFSPDFAAEGWLSTCMIASSSLILLPPQTEAHAGRQAQSSNPGI
jgi:hypothetical protein